MASQMLTFLRPMGLPRPSTVNQFLRRYATEAARSQKPSSLPNVSALEGTTATPLGASFMNKAKQSSGASSRGYWVTKTPSNQLPIYTLKKRGGNMKLTRIRRIEGDLAALKLDLAAALKVEEKEVTINQLTRHIMVKGHKKPEIEQFLKDCVLV